eukprot:gnl/MRDRNA2_/MRDRNA2_320808_c0_seq1.p1 gnl/MRDRNA2_/MRDRNA2_320808_c0~~gnl/MRDRNA2_/MRDRNA2_320808_c0_seq1.p1  ORF type:complete len:197 (+),score=45.55 gnl/MRDRNA2_/MRDRNA2_320808_c0_seq1:75-665(+)
MPDHDPKLDGQQCPPMYTCCFGEVFVGKQLRRNRTRQLQRGNTKRLQKPQLKMPDYKCKLICKADKTPHKSKVPQICCTGLNGHKKYQTRGVLMMDGEITCGASATGIHLSRKRMKENLVKAEEKRAEKQRQVMERQKQENSPPQEKPQEKQENSPLQEKLQEKQENSPQEKHKEFAAREKREFAASTRKAFSAFC